MKQPLLSRSYSVLQTDGTLHSLNFSLSDPIKDSDKDFFVVFEISSELLNKKLNIYGVDSFQAILLSIKHLKVELSLLMEATGAKIYWLDEANELGL